MPCDEGVHRTPAANQARVLCPKFAAQTGVNPTHSTVTGSGCGDGLDLGLLLTFELRAVELGVEAARSDELLMCAPLHDAPVVDDEDLIRLADRRQPVRDHE